MHTLKRKLESGGKENGTQSSRGRFIVERKEREREGSRRRKVATIRIFTGVIRYEPHNARNDGARCQRNSRRREVVHERSRPWKWAVGELDFSWGRRKLKIRQEYTGLVRSGSG